MALKVLLTDPDEEWLINTSEWLRGMQYEVDTADNGRSAQVALSSTKYYAIILAHDLEEHPALQVLKFIKTRDPLQQIIMLIRKQEAEESDKDYEKERKKFFNLGAGQVSIKPKDTDGILTLLEENQNLSQIIANIPKRDTVTDEVNIQESDDCFTKIKIDELFSTTNVLFDIYIKIKAGHFIKILHAGDLYSLERIKKYRDEKNVEFLYFKNTDIKKYIHFTNQLAKRIIHNENLTTSTKVTIIKNSAEKLLEEIDTEGMKDQIITNGKQICANMDSMIHNQKDLYKLLKDFEEFDPNAHTHAVTVSLFASAIVQQFDWLSDAPIKTVAMASLLHDIGKLKLPSEIIKMPVADMSEEQLEIYKTHPQLGHDLLLKNRSINNSVKQIILQHHESFNGDGFPTGTKGSKIPILSNIVCLANEFANLLIKEKLKPIPAIRKILTTQELISRYNLQIIERFINAFVDPDKLPKPDHMVVKKKKKSAS